MTIREIGALLRGRKISCVELMQQTLADVKERDKFNSLITVTADEALEEAKERDGEMARGVDRGPLHGVPTAHKDLFYTRGVRTTGGSLLYREFVPDHDAEVVRLLREAGAVSIGKTNLHELAYGITSDNPHYGAVLNPRDPSRIPGGSSGGSASLVAAGLLPMCLGTDTGGSIRIPASYCGITGLKPTYGRVSREGVLPLAHGLDHVGPLGSCVEDCALTMNAIAEVRDEYSREPLPNFRGVRVGVPHHSLFDRVDDEVARGVREAVETMRGRGAAVVKVAVPDLNEVNAATLVVQLVEASAIYTNNVDASLFSENFWGLIKQGELLAGHEYVNAQRLRAVFGRAFAAVWASVDVLAVPTTPVTAPPLKAATVQVGQDTEEVRTASTRLVRAMNFLGLPALSMPCGNAGNGMPIGLQLIAPAFKEPRLLQIARTLERLLNYAPLSSGRPEASIARQPPSSESRFV
ncbi:MAG: aspartyl/glutamyl-tRNA(Asn/Gln) amidotransferase subunit [Bryobacterales bacterium]|nr:aspartyl/glutamyl-tRNA(Asn/Gln) amidotransferase subunit [Bryobacterales bacterium]